MGGVRTTLALSVALACVWMPARAQATEPLRAIAREKAAAVAILREKAANEIATVAQGRLFSAYLTATTQGEGLRIKGRMEAAFGVIGKRFGLGELILVDRSGAVIAASAGVRAPSQMDVKLDPALKAGFAGEPRNASSLLTVKSGDPTLAYFSPVVWRGEKEFVLRASQDLAAYRALLAKPMAGKAFVVLVNANGVILSDTRPTTLRPGVKRGAFNLAGLSLSAMRGAVKGTASEGFGEVGNKKERFVVAYQAVGDWVIVAAQPISPPHRCPQDGDRLCG